MHYYQFHIGDYASHTRHLSLMEDLAYRRLLDFYYLHEQPIKQRDIARQIGMREHEQDVLTVLNEFFLSTEEGFISPRADKEIENYKSMSEGGKRGAAKRWAKGSDSPPMATPLAPPIATINHKPITNNHKPKKEEATDVALLPDWIPLETWAAFLGMRKKIKKPPTAHAIELLIAKLDKFRKAGHDVQAVLEKSITSGWQDVFELREMAQKTFAQQAADIARTTVPAANTGPDPALLKIEADRQKAVPMPEHIRSQIRSVMRKV